ncbi:hypothetical protein V8G54_023432, partial [Vigna mungo]
SNSSKLFLFFSRKLYPLTIVLQHPRNRAVSVATTVSFSRHHPVGVLEQEKASECLALPRRRSSPATASLPCCRAPSTPSPSCCLQTIAAALPSHCRRAPFCNYL